MWMKSGAFCVWDLGLFHVLNYTRNKARPNQTHRSRTLGSTVLERAAFPRALQTIFSLAVMVKGKLWNESIPVDAFLLTPAPQCSYQPAGFNIVNRVYAHLYMRGEISCKIHIAVQRPSWKPRAIEGGHGVDQVLLSTVLRQWIVPDTNCLKEQGRQGLEKRRLSVKD